MIIKKLLTTITLGTTLLFASNQITTKEIDTIKNKFPFVFQNPQVTVKKGYTNGNLLMLDATIQGNPAIIYYSKIDDKLIFGDIYDTNAHKLRLPIDKNILEAGIVNSYGTGKKVLYVVTDLECPYCKRLENRFDEKFFKEYTVKTIFYPLSFHSNAKQMSLYVLAAKTPKEFHERMKQTLNGSIAYKNFTPTQKEKIELEKKLSLSIEAAKELKVQGTPSVFDEDLNPFNYSFLFPKRK